MRLSSALLAKSAPHPRTHSRRICTSNTPKWLAGPRRRPQDVAGICRESLPWLLTPCSDMKLRMPSMKCMELEEPCMSFIGSHLRAKIRKPNLALSSSVHLRHLLRDKLKKLSNSPSKSSISRKKCWFHYWKSGSLIRCRCFHSVNFGSQIHSSWLHSGHSRSQIYRCWSYANKIR